VVPPPPLLCRGWFFFLTHPPTCACNFPRAPHDDDLFLLFLITSDDSTVPSPPYPSSTTHVSDCAFFPKWLCSKLFGLPTFLCLLAQGHLHFRHEFLRPRISHRHSSFLFELLFVPSCLQFPTRRTQVPYDSSFPCADFSADLPLFVTRITSFAISPLSRIDLFLSVA